ncbi:glycoside hydrolase family 13 protein [Alteromonas sediminis]|nr:glycoside hydrolase family 13 protein [Alteromonas sediminis]
MRGQFIVCSLLLVLCSCATSAVEVSPPSWWQGMKDHHLQLMVRHPNISDYSIETDFYGVSIVDSASPGGDNYLMVDLELSEQMKPGEATFTLTGPEGDSLSFTYTFAQRAAGSAQRAGFDASDVIYLITPDRFANGDPKNDTVSGYKEQPNTAYKGGRHGGDIAGIMANLDYLSEMGFTQIWTMPLLENAMPQYSYHGYSTTDYFKIDPRFGSNEEYRLLSDKARDKGIGIIKDVVLNHIGSEHIWMKDRPSEDWVNHNFEFVPTSHRREALHDPHGVEADAKAHSEGWFVPTMPDLNQRNPYVAQYLIQHAIWWIEFANLSGLRVDTYSYADKQFLSQWTKRIMTEYPNLNIVGEEWSVNPMITAYWQKGSLRHDNYQTDLPSVMDFPLQVALVNSIKNPERWDVGLRQLYDILAADFVYGDPYDLVIFGDNHDMSRITTQLDDDYDKWNIAMTILLTTRGIPQIFYGTEIMMHHPGTDDHGFIRADFPGGFSDKTVNAFTGQGLTDKQKKAQARLKLLLNKRKASQAITNGRFIHYSPHEGTYVYFRHMAQSEPEVMVVVNKNTETTTLDLTRFTRHLFHAKSMVRWKDDAELPVGQSLTLPAMSATVYTLHSK